MTKGIKKYLALILAVVLCLSGFAGVKLAAKAEGEVTYVQVTELGDVLAGGEFVVVAKYGEKYFAMSTEYSTKNEQILAAVEVTDMINGNELTGADLPVWTLTVSEAGKSVNMSNANGYLYHVKGAKVIYADALDVTKVGETKVKSPNWIVTEGAIDGTFQFDPTTEGARAMSYRIGEDQFDFGVVDHEKDPICNLMVFAEKVEAPTEEPTTEEPTTEEPTTEEPTTEEPTTEEPTTEEPTTEEPTTEEPTTEEPTTEEPTTEESTEEIGDVETGDSAQMILWALAMISAVAAVVVVLNKKRYA